MTPEIEKAFLDGGFTPAQIEEISLGMDSGIRYEIYTDKNLMPQQMYQLRIGLEQGLDMIDYAKPEYDWFQLEEIREGLSRELNVSLYDSPDIPSKKMHQMRRGLEEGIDLSDFLNYDVDIIREVRKSLLAHVDILNYVNEGYDGEQLASIWQAMADGLDIPQYLKPEFSCSAIDEIAEGLRDGLDVELYAKTDYTWGQMREIRFGLLNQIDVTYYLDPLYNRKQMMEIRLGLEEGLPASDYASLMFPANIMHKMRLESDTYDDEDYLPTQGPLENLDFDTDSDENEESKEKKDRKENVTFEENRDGITINVSPDDMVAFIRVNVNSYGKVTRKDILRSLRVAGITQNIDARTVDNLLAGRDLGDFVPIARGRKAVDGKDGEFEYFFDTTRKREPKLLPDGSVDFQNTQWYEEVHKDQKLAYYHSAGNGIQGFTVTGKPIPSKKGKELPRLKGKGFYVLPDEKTYVSEYDGRVSVENGKMEVSSILTLQDVNRATGNVKFAGNVNIAGDVSDGVTVEAGGDIVIDGFVGDCTIKSNGDILIKKGVNGGGVGCVEAKGCIEAKFFESASIRAGKHIKANYCLNSDVYCEDAITIFGNKGLILGGMMFATRDIQVTNVGSDIGLRTVIRMGVSNEMLAQQRTVESHLADLSNKLMVLEKGRSDIEEKYPPEIRSAMDMYIKIENAIYTIHKEMDEYNATLDNIMAQIAATAESMLTVSGTLFDNVMIEIDGKRVLSSKQTGVCVKKVDNRVCILKNAQKKTN